MRHSASKVPSFTLVYAIVSAFLNKHMVQSYDNVRSLIPFISLQFCIPFYYTEQTQQNSRSNFPNEKRNTFKLKVYT